MTAKLKQLEELEVIEKVNGPTSWINPLVVLEKPNGDIRICLDMRQANRAIFGETPRSHSGRNITGDFRSKSFQ